MLLAPVEDRPIASRDEGREIRPGFRTRPPARFGAGRPARSGTLPPARFAFGADVVRFGGRFGSNDGRGVGRRFGSGGGRGVVDVFGGDLTLPGLAGWFPSTIRAEADPSRRAAEPASAEPSSRVRWRESVEAAKAFIEEHLGEPIDVVRISREANLSPSHFTRVFRALEGVPPWSYVTERRVRRAEELLGSDRPLSEIAFDTGFADQAHFTRVFKRVTGSTPGAARAARRNGPDVQDGETGEG